MYSNHSSLPIDSLFLRQHPYALMAIPELAGIVNPASETNASLAPAFSADR